MRTIRASEIAEYVFCHRAWWLHQVQGLASANVSEQLAGVEAHARHGRLVGLASALRALAVALVITALLLLAASAAGVR